MKLIEMQRCQGLFSVDSQSGRLVLNVACEKVLRRHDATSAEQKRQIGEHRSPSSGATCLVASFKDVRGGGVVGRRRGRKGGDVGGLRDVPEPSAPVDKMPPDIN